MILDSIARPLNLNSSKLKFFNAISVSIPLLFFQIQPLIFLQPLVNNSDSLIIVLDMITTPLPLEIPHLDVSNVRRIISFNRINVFLEKSYQMNALISKSIKMSVSLVKLVTSFLKMELNVLPILKEFKDVKFISLKMIVFLVFLTFSKWNTLAIQ
jgi:hypothetical protein